MKVDRRRGRRIGPMSEGQKVKISATLKQTLAATGQWNKKPRELRACKVDGCVNIFECIVDSDREWCSTRCYNVLRRVPREIRVCRLSGCNNIFSSNWGQQYCSPDCSSQRRGEQAPNWQGGHSSTYRFPCKLPFNWEEIAEGIRERDNNTCQVCDRTQEEEVHGRKLSVHHIDDDEENCDDDNLITLCHRCHCRTMWGEKEYWKEFLMKLMGIKLAKLLVA